MIPLCSERRYPGRKRSCPSPHPERAEGEALPVGTAKGHEALAPCTTGYLASCNVTRHTCASFDLSCRVEE